MTKTSLAHIERRIARIKDELVRTGDMRPGSLTTQYKDRTTRAGPYYQLSYTLEMKSRTEYIRKEFVGDIRRQISHYKRFKKLSTEWISLSIEHSRLSMKRRQSE